MELDPKAIRPCFVSIWNDRQLNPVLMVVSRLSECKWPKDNPRRSQHQQSLDSFTASKRIIAVYETHLIVCSLPEDITFATTDEMLIQILRTEYSSKLTTG
jgi:hypothetical protein